MNAKDFDKAVVDQEEAIRREEEELARLLGDVMRAPLSPVSQSLARVETQVGNVDEAIRSMGKGELAGLAAQVMDLADGFTRLEGAVRDSGEEVGEALSRTFGSRFDEARASVAAIGSAHEHTHAALVAALNESQRQVSAGIEALNAQGVSALAAQQEADARIEAAVELLRTGIAQQNDALTHGMTTLAQQLQAHQQANAEALASGVSEVAKRIAAVQREVRWFGIVATLCGFVTLALLLLHR